MRYYHADKSGKSHVLAQNEADDIYDLTAANANVETISDLLRAASIANEDVDEVASRLGKFAPSLAEGAIESVSTPLRADEVWAAGVTYEISEQARREESSMSDVYLDVYDGERPEVFFKATSNHLAGPNKAVGIRGDSDWDVPEPELGVVLHCGEIVGYTVGNDMSSRSIEGQNPLYLPQAKVYDRCCSIGPCIASPSTVGDPHDLEMWMTIYREGDTMYEGSTNTGKMARSVPELVECYTNHNAVPELSVLLTGTALVPEDFTLEEGDIVEIDIEKIGHLRNSVTVV